MYKILAIEISIIFQVLANTLPENKTYAALVKEKGELFKEINEAIQESIAVLKKNNDTEAALGIEYMNQLKEQLKEINGTDITPSNNDTNVDTRRRNKVTLNMAEIAAFLQTKTDTKTAEKKKLSEENKARVQKDLDLWLMQDQIEQHKIAKTKKKKVVKKLEECPRIGRGQPKKKKKVSRRKDGGPAADTTKTNCTNTNTSTTTETIIRFPCCRKCCKKSYMGCL